jgi:hypothetical protein
MRAPELLELPYTQLNLSGMSHPAVACLENRGDRRSFGEGGWSHNRFK